MKFSRSGCLLDERETEGRIPLRVDFSLPSNDETLRQFGGAASYEIEFDGTGLGESTILGLGEVHSTSEVTLNEVPLGWHWWGGTVIPSREPCGRVATFFGLRSPRCW